MHPNNTDRPDILYEDNHIIIANKAPGILVQGDRTGDIPLLERVRQYIKAHYNKPGNVFLGLVHRLDRPVSGAVIFARTSKALERLNRMMRQRNISKIYHAVVEGIPASHEATLIHYLRKNPRNNKTTVFTRPTPGAKEAVLHYRLIAVGERYALLEIDLKTGRHHQIRAQLAKAGHPVKGDLKYGAKRSNPFPGIMLHARRLIFEHPVRRTALNIVAPYPDTHWDWIGNFDTVR